MVIPRRAHIFHKNYTCTYKQTRCPCPPPIPTHTILMATKPPASHLTAPNSHPYRAFQVDVVVSCLASRTGGIKDSWAVDYQATLNSMNAGREQGASHFVLLSAICVQVGGCNGVR
jgi:hypothetical protein